ncbi:MAG TPA: hypothetical protein VFS61_06080, partial [Anaerolineales bacterium]|nr:hypothetical protein [Anaerolineales bacterium]
MLFPILKKSFTRISLVILFIVIAPGLHASPTVHAQGQKQPDLLQFDLLTAHSGWILLDGQLFLTLDAGQSWKEITPSIPAGAEVQDVQFIDTNTGWMLWTTADSSGSPSFHIAHTRDGGQRWETQSLSLFEPGDIASYMEKAEMGWFDGETGWISVKGQSGSNFSTGTLFTTYDGAKTWKRFDLPVADSIDFSDPQMGWAVGGPGGGEIFQTQDGGATWKDARPSDLSNEIQAVAHPPIVADGQGLFLATTMAAESHLNLYSLENADHWIFLDQVKLDSASGAIEISILDTQNLVAVIPGTDSIVRMRNGKVDVLNNQDGRSASIVRLDMVALNVGWAKSITSDCGDASCSMSTRLLQTTDGGLTWQSIKLPLVGSDTILSAVPDFPPSSPPVEKAGTENTEVYLGQGFDTC